MSDPRTPGPWSFVVGDSRADMGSIEPGVCDFGNDERLDADGPKWEMHTDLVRIGFDCSSCGSFIQPNQPYPVKCAGCEREYIGEYVSPRFIVEVRQPKHTFLRNL